MTARRRLFKVTDGIFNNRWNARYDVLPGDSAFVMIDLGQGTGQAEANTILVQNPVIPRNGR